MTKSQIWCKIVLLRERSGQIKSGIISLIYKNEVQNEQENNHKKNQRKKKYYHH